MAMDKGNDAVGAATDRLRKTTGALRDEESWHSVNSDVYHNNPNCQAGNSIDPDNVQQGTGDKPLCGECERLNSSGGPVGETTDKDELRVQRTEEELRVGTHEREIGAITVRKHVRTEQESLSVPTRREEVTVERVPVESETSEAEIGEEDIRIPVTEEEVVVEKRPVVKEEIRIRKDVVEETEVVEEELRREEVEIDDESTERTR